MKQTRQIMGMPITVEIIDESADQSHINSVFKYFKQIDKTFSTFKKDSEISKINRGELQIENASLDVGLILKLSDQTKRETKGFFDVWNKRYLDPSGLVKGWAIQNAAEMLSKKFDNFYVEAGGDIQFIGLNKENKKWKVGIRNPLDVKKIVKVLTVSNCGVATSGTYERGEHIYDPHTGIVQDKIISLTVIGPNIYEADRFATAAFAMGERGIQFIEEQKTLEGYMINKEGVATMTSGFENYVE